MASVFTTGTRTKSSKKFEIRLDSPFVVFNGEPYEAEPIHLTGTLILNNTDHMNVRSIKIRLEGKWRVSWFVEPSTSTSQIKDKGIVINEEMVLYPAEGQGISSVAHKIAPGNHEWRFSFYMNSHLPESVEGLPGSYIVYGLTAEIDRGYMSKNLVASKHVRVIRTLGRDLTDTVPMPYSNEDTWTDKLWYHIYLPTRYYIFGTSITAEFTLCPLHKGLTIGKIRMEVLERVTLSTEQGRYKMKQTDQIVASCEQDVPENSLQPLTEEQTGIADESYHFKVTLPLERSLIRARQSLDTDNIKIWHNLKIYVNLHNPDGHVSQLVVRNLVHIFISPNLPVGDDQCVSANPAQIAEASATHETSPEAPPTYGSHQLDQLYGDIDTGAFMSGRSTPLGQNALSRHSSSENLRRSVDATHSNGHFSGDSSPSANQLLSRLAALQERYDSRWSSQHPLSFGMDDDFTNSTPRSDSIGSFINPYSTSASRSNSLRQFVNSQHHSRRSSGQGSYPPTTQQFSASAFAVQPVSSPIQINGEYDMEALARIPSYNTAVRTPLSQSPGQEGLPTYDIAMSTPNSPQISGASVQPPQQIHTHNRRESDELSESASLATIRADARLDAASIPMSRPHIVDRHRSGS